MTTIELDDKDAELFKQFRKHQDGFEALLNAGVFDIRNGDVILSFNEHGIMTLIRGDLELFRRKAKSKSYPPMRSIPKMA